MERLLKFAGIVSMMMVAGFAAISAQGDPGAQGQPVASITKKISAGGPTLTFKLFAVDSFSNWHYRILVCWADGSQVLQDLGEIRNGINVAGRRDGFVVSDPKGDGFAEIQLLGGVDKSGKSDKAWYKVWVYQPATKSYAFETK